MYLWGLRCVFTSRVATFFLLVVALTSLSFSYYTFVTTRLPFNLPSVRSEDCVTSRRELARRVMRAEKQVQKLTGKMQGVMSPSLSHELRAIARELDPRITTDLKEAPETSGGLVCQEVYRGKNGNPDCDNSFVTLQCDDVPPFKEVLTILLSTKGWTEERVIKVVRNIRKSYDVEVMVLTYGYSGSLKALDVEGVSVHDSSANTVPYSAINAAVAKVKTPFVLLADSLTHFSRELTSLERLVRVLDQEGEGAGVAAGSYRTLDGTWTHGCLQRRLENYQLSYVSGYEHSHHECMFCDDVLGPFVARTNLLRKVLFKDSLEGPATLRDWFISVALNGSLAVACPDVMFFVDETPSMGRQDWLKVASTWAVQDVWPHDGGKLEFSCEELDMKCVNLMKLVSSFLVPPCCRKALRQELGLVQECAEELGLYLELNAGSLLGAVKNDGILPWDFDLDVSGDCKDKEVWLNKGTECMSRKGCNAAHIEGSYWIASCNVSFSDITCKTNRLKFLPAEYHNVPTRVNYDGRMINVPPNPALVSRNCYGPEYLRHEVHWRYTEDKGVWNRCLHSGFHPCLENYPTDGNIKFMNFGRQLVGL